MPQAILRYDWRIDEIESLLGQPFNDLLFRAQQVHRAHFDANSIQVSSLLSIKTGACSEDCGYCSQSAKHNTSLEKEKLLPLKDVVAAAESANSGSPVASVKVSASKIKSPGRNP